MGHGPPSPRRGRGFTLIELLVVIVIIGVVSSVVLLSMGLLGDDRALHREARRMASLIELAADDAVLQGRDFGIEITRYGYRFVEHDPIQDRWHEVLGDDLLTARELPEAMRFELSMEDRNIVLNETPAKLAGADEDEEQDDARNTRSDDYTPHGLILSSGEISPMHLEILRETDRRSITLDITAAGEIEVAKDDAPAD